MGSNPIYLFFRFAMARLDNKIAHRPKYSFKNNSHTSEPDKYVFRREIHRDNQ